MRRRRAALLGTVGVTMTLIAGSTSVAGASPDPKDMTMVNVVKVKGIPWFDRMAVGDENFAKRTGVHISQEGGADTSPQKQVQLVADLIPRHPTAITVVPNSPESLESVMKQARSQGVVVVSHDRVFLDRTVTEVMALESGGAEAAQ